MSTHLSIYQAASSGIEYLRDITVNDENYSNWVAMIGIATLAVLGAAYCCRRKKAIAPSRQLQVEEDGLAPLFAKCQEMHIRVNESQSMARFIQLHEKLWLGSERYRQLISEVEKTKQEPVTFMDGELAIRMLKKQGKESILENYPFRACWVTHLNAVVVFKPEERLDKDVGSVMAFELTNAFQDEELNNLNRDALNGNFVQRTAASDEHALDKAAELYAHAHEKIEVEGRKLHDEIISQAIAAKTIDVSWHWSGGESDPSYKRVHKQMLSEYGQKHIKYYADFYKTRIAPCLVPKKDALVRRMANLSNYSFNNVSSYIKTKTN